jgi:hypothetical protein
MRIMDPIPEKGSTDVTWAWQMRQLDGKRFYDLPPVSFSVGPSRDPSRPYIPLIEPIGNIRVDHRDWGHDPIDVPVDNLIISFEAPWEEDDSIGPGSTKLFINSKPYNPEQKLSEFGEPTGEMRMVFDGQGKMSEFGIKRASSSGFTNEDPTGAVFDAEGFIDRVHLAVQATADAYVALPEDPGQFGSAN